MPEKPYARIFPGITPSSLQNAVFIAGPTSGGKSSLAFSLALRCDGVIVNTDSMQVYDGLEILTSRPAASALAKVPHFLYGHVPSETPYSVGAWLHDLASLLLDKVFEGRRVFFVGGTGLYFRALMGGLHALPQIPAHVRADWRLRLSQEGSVSLYRILKRKDPVAAMRLNPSDGHRILRALEVFEVSGRSLFSWHKEPLLPSVVDLSSAQMILLEPDNKTLGSRIRARIEEMIQSGALDEVRAFLERKPDISCPAMKAIGVHELSEVLEGRITSQEAVCKMSIRTCQYAKRQKTWFRHQCGPEWRRMAQAEPDFLYDP